MADRAFDLVTTVRACVECKHCSCPAWDHDCAFTPSPMPGGHYCKAANERVIPDPKQVAGWCPLVAAQRGEVSDG